MSACASAIQVPLVGFLIEQLEVLLVQVANYLAAGEAAHWNDHRVRCRPTRKGWSTLGTPKVARLLRDALRRAKPEKIGPNSLDSRLSTLGRQTPDAWRAPLAAGCAGPLRLGWIVTRVSGRGDESKA